MTSTSSYSNGMKSTTKFTTTATINCSAYPSSPSTALGSASPAERWNAAQKSKSFNNPLSQSTSPPFATRNGGSAFSAPKMNGNHSTGAPAPPPMPSKILTPSGFKNGTLTNGSSNKSPASKPNFRIKTVVSVPNSVPRGFSPNYQSPSTNTNFNNNNISSNNNTTYNNTVKHNTMPRNFGKSTTNPSPNSLNMNTLRRVESTGTNPSGTAKPKADPNDPQVRKLVYNMYRGLLDKKHEKSNTIISSVPDTQVEMDMGVTARVISMM